MAKAAFVPTGSHTHINTHTTLEKHFERFRDSGGEEEQQQARRQVVGSLDRAKGRQQ